MKRINELFDVEEDFKILSLHSDSRYVVWTLREGTAPFVQIEKTDANIEYKSIISTTSDPGSYYSNCNLDSSTNLPFSSKGPQ